MRASLVCFKKVSKVGRASSGKCNLRGRMRVVSTIKYYNNIQMLRHTMCLPSYRNKAFPTQIFRKLLFVPTCIRHPDYRPARLVGIGKGSKGREAELELDRRVVGL